MDEAPIRTRRLIALAALVSLNLSGIAHADGAGAGGVSTEARKHGKPNPTVKEVVEAADRVFEGQRAVTRRQIESAWVGMTWEALDRASGNPQKGHALFGICVPAGEGGIYLVLASEDFVERIIHFDRGGRGRYVLPVSVRGKEARWP